MRPIEISAATAITMPSLANCSLNLIRNVAEIGFEFCTAALFALALLFGVGLYVGIIV